MTVRDLLTKAFRFIRVLGVGEAMASDEADDALITLNSVIEQANIDKTLAYYQTSIVFTTIAAKVSYTIGPASTTPDVVAPRPVEILSGYSRRSNVDYPLFVGSKQDYDRIQYKNIQVAGWEKTIYYEAAWPKGTVYLYQVPQDTSTELHLATMAEVPVYSTLDDVVSLPPGYSFWLQCATGKRLAPEYGMPFTTDMAAVFEDVQASIKRNNLKPTPIALTGLSGLTSRNPGYNILTDGTNR